MEASTHSCFNFSMIRYLKIPAEAYFIQWQSLITHRGPYDVCNGVQLLLTALLGQIYGALSKVCCWEPPRFRI